MDDILDKRRERLGREGLAGGHIDDHTGVKIHLDLIAGLDGGRSLRAFQDEVFEDLQEGIRRIGREVAQQTGCTVDVQMNDGYPAVLNPAPLFDRVVNCGIPFTPLEKPVMITEDFSWYQRHLPGMFFFLGAGPAPALHADHFDFDEKILCRGADFFETIVTRYREKLQG